MAVSHQGHVRAGKCECWLSLHIYCNICGNRFGVCCLFKTTDQSTVTQNCTYIQNPGYPGTLATESDVIYNVRKVLDSKLWMPHNPYLFYAILHIQLFATSGSILRALIFSVPRIPWKPTVGFAWTDSPFRLLNFFLFVFSLLHSHKCGR